MNEIVFEIIKLVLMVSILVVTRYLVPYIKERIGIEKLAIIEKWAQTAVLSAQQLNPDKTGREKKAIVNEFMRKILRAKNISISDEQVDALIEAAIKQMKITENSGIVIEAVDNMEVPEYGSEDNVQ